MTLNELISRAASVYPAAWVLKYWDAKKQCTVVNPSGGDTLAEFVACEIEETFDPQAGDDKQLDTAIRKMQEAANDLTAVVGALENLKQERKTKCTRWP